MEQSLLVTTIRRPWHWGIAVVTGPGQTEDFPEIEPGRPFCSTSGALVIMVRHAQDVEDIDHGFAEATVSISLHQDEVTPDDGKQAIGEGILSTPEGTLSVGDADMNVVVPAHKGMTQFLISIEGPSDLSPEHVRVDLWPVVTS
ncbi:hypothetical protein J2X01_000104 [Arthrobacter ginsengisoli]|uniref:Uncharacterized protein n=1 Tax=Arthrobacter ginsengisoli TaxID=1356565 RepID=A0ABU1U6Q7_9MICC|nr:hypothetical protein [Arthrobacter ginsengisoli]MDR7080835.1 hypothetical protein [Arthrobacter ginsengisoli]